MVLLAAGREQVPGGDVGHVEAEHEGERDQVQEGVEILHHALKQAEYVKSFILIYLLCVQCPKLLNGFDLKLLTFFSKFGQIFDLIF